MIATAADTLHEFITLIAKRHAQNWAEASRYRGESDPSTVYRWESTSDRDATMRQIVAAGLETEIRNSITKSDWSMNEAIVRLNGDRLHKAAREFTRDILEMGITSVKCGSVTL